MERASLIRGATDLKNLSSHKKKRGKLQPRPEPKKKRKKTHGGPPSRSLRHYRCLTSAVFPKTQKYTTCAPKEGTGRTLAEFARGGQEDPGRDNSSQCLPETHRYSITDPEPSKVRGEALKKETEKQTTGEVRTLNGGHALNSDRLRSAVEGSQSGLNSA